MISVMKQDTGERRGKTHVISEIFSKRFALMEKYSDTLNLLK